MTVQNSSLTGYPGIEPRVWWSPTHGYFLMRWSRQAGSELVDTWIVHWEGTGTAVELPGDAVEIGAFPTQWAYDRACEALHSHTQRADNLAGRLERLRLKVAGALNLRPDLPVEAAVDMALNRALGAPPVSVGQRRTWDAAYTRVSALAGLKPDEGEVSTWSLVERALRKAENDADLHREVLELAETLNVGLTSTERSPAWLTS